MFTGGSPREGPVSSQTAKPADEVVNGIDWDADGPADVDDLEVAGGDEFVHRAPGDAECPAGSLDGQQEHETASVLIVGRRGENAVSICG
jgi:hypothetical protein